MDISRFRIDLVNLKYYESRPLEFYYSGRRDHNATLVAFNYVKISFTALCHADALSRFDRKAEYMIFGCFFKYPGIRGFSLPWL